MRRAILFALILLSACGKKDPKACKEACDKTQREAHKKCGPTDAPSITDAAKIARLTCAIDTYDVNLACMARCDGK